MLIANPIYDVVFKYMMDDNKVAKLLLSAILGEEIVELDFSPTELRLELANPPVTVYRLDFAAKIKNAEGAVRLSLIEVQKAKLPEDIMRFRRYLGSQYADENNSVVIGKKKDGTDIRKGFHIVTIYFLGHWLEHTLAPVIKVNRQCFDLTTGELLIKKEEFIESLTHDSYVIQVPALKGRRQTDLLRLLSIFDQDNAESNYHLMNVEEEDIPEKYRPVIRRLQKACAIKEVRDTMTVEDDIVRMLQVQERAAAFILKEKDREIEGKDREIEEKDKEIEEKNKEIERLKNEEKDKEIEEKDREIEKKDKEIERLKKLLGI